MTNYRNLFESIEKSLLSEGTKNLPLEQIQERLEKFKHFENRVLSDTDYYRILVNIVFYAGFKAATVSSKLEIIHKHLGDFEIVSNYSEKEIDEILEDKRMIKNRNKVKACVENAKVFRSIVREYGSFKQYVESFNGRDSGDGFMLLKDELKSKFSRLGEITVYHFLMDIGFQVLKPDRVICRIFERLGLIENRDRIYKAISQGKKFSEETGYPIRYIDIVFVAYGQDESMKFGIKKGICSETNPSCHLCEARNFCNYYPQQSV